MNVLEQKGLCEAREKPVKLKPVSDRDLQPIKSPSSRQIHIIRRTDVSDQTQSSIFYLEL